MPIDPVRRESYCKPIELPDNDDGSDTASVSYEEDVEAASGNDSDSENSVPEPT